MRAPGLHLLLCIGTSIGLGALMAGCAAQGLRSADDAAHRRATGEGCATPDDHTPLLATPAAFVEKQQLSLKDWKESLVLQCPATQRIDETYTVSCKASIEAVLAVVNERQSPPVTMAQVSFKRRAGCIDTFIPGCEMWDCAEWLEVGIPTRNP